MLIGNILCMRLIDYCNVHYYGFLFLLLGVGRSMSHGSWNVTSAGNDKENDNGSSEGSSHISNPAVQTINVLVVDDSMACRTMTRKSIMVSGKNTIKICCDMAADGKKGVDMVKYNMQFYDTANTSEGTPATTGNMKMTCEGVYDMIFMDYQMPVMDGPTAIKAIRAMGFKGRIVGLTGNALQSDQDYMRESGANSILLKPVSQEALEAAIYNRKVNAKKYF